MRTLKLSPLGRIHLSALLLTMGQDEAGIADLVGKEAFGLIKDHPNFPMLLEHYDKKRRDEDFALSTIRGVALINFLRWAASEHPNASIRATNELLDRIGLPSLSVVTERAITDGGSKLTLTEERRTLEITGTTNEERARLFSQLRAARGHSLLRLNPPEGADS